MLDRAAISKQISQISQLAELPQHIRNIIIQNKKMIKKIFILEAELSEKKGIIQQLKEQLDSTVIEQTQIKLITIRNIQQQVNQQVNQIKHKFYEKDSEMQGEIQGLRQVIDELKSTINQFEFREQNYLRKVESLKQYIAEALNQKDLLITELAQIINQQQQKIKSCSFCSKTSSEICRQSKKNDKSKKKTPYIARNQ